VGIVKIVGRRCNDGKICYLGFSSGSLSKIEL